MSAQAEIPRGHPMRDAWEAYKATAEYANSRNWALKEAHVDGSMWAAFCAGYKATAADAAVGAQGDGDTHAFKNFHRMLCERFGYVHDERDWRRDQVSLIEHIAAPAAGKGVDDAMVEKIIERVGRENSAEGMDGDSWDRLLVRAALTRQPATCECAECRRKRALARNGSPFIMDPLPERDASKPNSEQGLYRKFDVRRTDGGDEPGGKHHGCEYFVLDVKHDPLAKAALTGYADAAEATHPQLAADLRERYTLTRQPVAGDGK